MELHITDNAKDLEIEYGDIVVIDNVAYLDTTEKNYGVCTDTLLLGLDGQSDSFLAYYDLYSLKREVSKKEDVKLYKANDYILKMFKKD
ncbi:hypothetical protein [Paraliobacillus ryukyuensis]|uniref:hypothetical protein n=1 Tax=Paraliobacillus ryukyuensis TaxID=200904 RepID=UPI0009A635D1|nr:hypothetical protein [Paraliobacillus ryukyuensis]